MGATIFDNFLALLGGGTAGQMLRKKSATFGDLEWATPVAAADFAASLATNGYQRLPSGLYLQWGTATSHAVASTRVAVTFPRACTTVFSVQVTPRSTNNLYAWTYAWTGTGFEMGCYGANEAVSWLAITD